MNISHKALRSLKAILRPTLALPAAVLLLNISGSPVQAAGVVFKFTGLPNNTSAPSSGNDDSSLVANYMNGLLHAAEPSGSNWNVSVLGAESSGSATSAGYTGDGHVVCGNGARDTYYASGSLKKACTSDTLSTKSVNPSPYIMTSGKTTIGGNNAIVMAFSGDIAVSSLSFDFEIFPDATCTVSNCSTPPDFTFMMTAGASTIEDVTVLAKNVGTGPTTTSVGINGTLTGGASELSINKYSPTSGHSQETAEQYLGTLTFNFATPVVNPTLTFIDWPATIAVTNIDWGLPPPQNTPEPGSLMLLGTGLLGLGLARRWKKRRSA